jgi:hypothetical protein
LAAHQEQNEARSHDWRSIVERLVFQDAGGAAQMYDTGHLFFFGVRPLLYCACLEYFD